MKSIFHFVVACCLASVLSQFSMMGWPTSKVSGRPTSCQRCQQPLKIPILYRSTHGLGSTAFEQVDGKLTKVVYVYGYELLFIKARPNFHCSRCNVDVCLSDDES